MNSKTYQLTIRPEHDASDVDGIRRVRLLLKRMLRTLRIRCLSIVEATEATETNCND